MGWFLPVLFMAGTAAATWGWAVAESERTKQAQAGTQPIDPIASIFGGGSDGGGLLGGLGGILPILLMGFMLFKNRGSGDNGDGDDDQTNIIIVEDDD